MQREISQSEGRSLHKPIVIRQKLKFSFTDFSSQDGRESLSTMQRTFRQIENFLESHPTNNKNESGEKGE